MLATCTVTSPDVSFSPSTTAFPLTSPVVPTTVTLDPLRISCTVYPAAVWLSPCPATTVHCPSIDPDAASAPLVDTTAAGPPPSAMNFPYAHGPQPRPSTATHKEI